MTDLPIPSSDPAEVVDLLASEYGSITGLEERPPTLDDRQRARLADLADALIAGGYGFPSASAAEVPTTWIDRALQARPDLVDVVRGAVEQDGTAQQVLDRLRETEPAVFSDFTFVVCGAYLINPRVRKLFGYPGVQPVRNPAFPDEAEAYLEDGLLDAVIARGDLYRPTPGEV